MLREKKAVLCANLAVWDVNRKEATTAFLSRYLNGPLPYV